MNPEQTPFNMAYPRVITPDVHQLREHYKTKRNLTLTAIPVLFLVNELLFREHIAVYQRAPESPISLLILAINGTLPTSEANYLRNLILGLAIVIASIACLLPKWTLGPRGQIFRSNQPLDFEELGLAQFHVKNKTQHVIFWVWHHVLSWLGVAGAPILFCFLLNLARS